MNKIFVFDLDGTLAKSKSSIDEQMTMLLIDILWRHKVCVISGGKWGQFQEQLIKPLRPLCAHLDRLHLFPTCGTSYYKAAEPKGGKAIFKKIYQHDLHDVEVIKVMDAFKATFRETGYIEFNTVGKIIENRGSQVTFSALGQEAPLKLKKAWDPDRKRRKAMLAVLQPLLPEFDVRLGGTTSVDVTRKGMDKGFGISMIEKHLSCDRSELIFFGDALEPGGNDHAVYKAGVLCVPVDDPLDCIWKVKLHL